MNEITMLYIALVLSIFSTAYILYDVLYLEPIHIENERIYMENQQNRFAHIDNKQERHDAMLEWMFQTICNEHSPRCSEAFSP